MGAWYVKVIVIGTEIGKENDIHSREKKVECKEGWKVLDIRAVWHDPYNGR